MSSSLSMSRNKEKEKEKYNKTKSIIPNFDNKGKICFLKKLQIGSSL